MKGGAPEMSVITKKTYGQNVMRRMYKERWAYILLIPVITYFVLFHYFPIYGIQLAFKNFVVRLGIQKSPWVGTKHFETLLRSVVFHQALRNTILISLYKLLFGFTSGVLFALLINELRNRKFKSFIQSVSYLPHFLSWVILGGIIRDLLSPQGPLTMLYQLFGGQQQYLLTDPGSFRTIVVVSGIWKEVGWASIIYLAAIAGINTELYEAATIDGASRIKIILRIILPLLLPVMSIQFILQLGNILNAGFDQIFNLYNPLVYSTGDIIDTYVYRIGLTDKLQYSLATAVGLFKSVIGLCLVLTTNAVIRRIDDGAYSIW
jgi:putative aldouronate transport system permease protein